MIYLRSFVVRYTALEKSGDIEPFSSSPDLSKVRAFDEIAIQNAIDDLKRSTEAIEKQTETLKIQQDAIASLVNTSKQNQEARKSANNKQYKAWLSEHDHLSTSVSCP